MDLLDEVASGEDREETNLHADSQLGEHRTLSPQEEASGSLPDDLLDVDTSLVDTSLWEDDKSAPKISKTPGLPPGFTEAAAAKRRPYGRVLLVIAVMAAVAVSLIGYVQRQGLSALLSRASPPSTTLVDSHDGVVLMLEQSGDLRRVIVEKSGRANWLLVSKDDTTATNPALSSDGQQVAYVTERGGGQLVVASLITDTRRTIDADQIEGVGDSAGLDRMKLCAWTPIAWAPPAGDRIAFFGCVEDSSFSVAVVGDLSDSAANLTIVAPSKAKASDARQLKWLDHKQLVVSMPATDAQQAEVTTFVVP